jgi:hypothetical protein
MHAFSGHQEEQPTYEAATWNGFVVRSGTPPAVVDQIKIRHYAAHGRIKPLGDTPEKFATASAPTWTSGQGPTRGWNQTRDAAMTWSRRNYSCSITAFEAGGVFRIALALVCCMLGVGAERPAAARESRTRGGHRIGCLVVLDPVDDRL